MDTLAKHLIFLLILTCCFLPARAQTKNRNSDTGFLDIPLTDLDKVYRDESHCLTQADMRGDKDMAISCWCRDAIVDARYVYFTYVLSGNDQNLNGPFLHLQRYAAQECGEASLATYNTFNAINDRDWKWNGPEVVRTYPPDEAIKRIAPEHFSKGGTTLGRWVPFTVRLVYLPRQGGACHPNGKLLNP